MFFAKPTLMDLLKMIWWGLWNPPKPVLALPPIKKLQMVPASHCPTCRRPY